MIPAYVRHREVGLVIPNTRAKLIKDEGALLMFGRRPRLRPGGGRRHDGGGDRAVP